MGNFCAPSPFTPSGYCGKGVCVVGNSTSYCECAPGYGSSRIAFRAPDCYQPDVLPAVFAFTVGLVALVCAVALRVIARRRAIKGMENGAERLKWSTASLLVLALFALTHGMEGGMGPASLVLLLITANMLAWSQIWLGKVTSERTVLRVFLAINLCNQIAGVEWAVYNADVSDQFSYYGFSAGMATFGIAYSVSIFVGEMIVQPVQERVAPTTAFQLVWRFLVWCAILTPSLIVVSTKSLPYDYAILMALLVSVPVRLVFREWLH